MSYLKAFIRDKKTIVVHLNKNFYDGKSNSFRLKNYEGFSKELPIIVTNDCHYYVEYVLENNYFDLSREFFITEEHNMMAPLEVAFYVRSKEFNEEYYYDGDDLGNTYTKEKTIFKVWTPVAREVLLKSAQEVYPMKRLEYGVWAVEVLKDCELMCYTYLVNINGIWQETLDPYAYTSTPNGTKSVVIDLAKCAVDLCKNKLKPFDNPVDAIIYELHIRDFSTCQNSGLKNKGKFIAFTEKNTKTLQGNPTGLDYIESLGITHLQLLPFYDFGSVDELNQFDSYNWGYDPMQYNVPEGSYASEVRNPYSRVIDCKKMIAAIHERGIRVIMDVVYNHMFGVDVTAFHKLMPYYYFRYGENGEVSNGSFCGNDIDSLMPMASKYIVDSIKHWTSFYGIDGYRFDLMGILDIDTMNRVYQEAKKLEPSIIIYGEGWNMPSLLPDELKAAQFNNEKLIDIGFFNDRFRDRVKGATMTGDVLVRGYATGLNKELNVLCDSLMGTCYKVNYGYHYQSPNQVINYVECHDNHTVWDKMCLSNAEETINIRKKRQMLMTAIVLLSQGVPFLHAGQEFCRTKKLDHNSYISSDEINQLDYNLMEENITYVNYVKALINFRKKHNEFRLKTTEDILTKVKTTYNKYGIVKYYVGDYLVIFNPNISKKKVLLKDEYSLINIYNDEEISCGKTILVDEVSTTILLKHEERAFHSSLLE